ncbi:conserved hypothetical protein [uncultured Desulfatiglans sp.]|nr:conserved hypothetical protein [uncultured Desulfatiglans sp.]
MPTLIIHFTAGRYHATPWGHHVNEGLVEWPPSPWRLLRAFLAVGYNTLAWQGDAPPLARSLIEKLASTLPTYRMPKATGAHSRHYMPLGFMEQGREKTTLVFDTWVRIGSGGLAVRWDVQLSLEEEALLSRIASHIGYIGRSESWVDAHLAKDGEPLPSGWICMPNTADGIPDGGWEEISLLAPQSPLEYLQSQAAALSKNPVNESSSSKPRSKTRKKAKRRDSAYPEHIIGCLQSQTSWLQEMGWNQPPGSKKVFYLRSDESLEAVAPLMTPRISSSPDVQSVLLAIATRSRNDHALPHVTRTMPQAERLHKAFIKQLQGRPNKALTGCDHNMLPLTEPHRHLHILPLDLDQDGHLDHVLLWAPMGLDETARSAVRAVRKTYAKGLPDPLQLSFAGMGPLDQILRLPGKYGEGLCAVSGGADGAMEWRSHTPFVPPRYIKKNGRNSLEGQVVAELASRGFPVPQEIGIYDPQKDEAARRMRHFIRARKSGPLPPVDCGFAVFLRFEKPVLGPLCLGYGSHFGLGLFVSGATAKKE